MLKAAGQVSSQTAMATKPKQPVVAKPPANATLPPLPGLVPISRKNASNDDDNDDMPDLIPADDIQVTAPKQQSTPPTSQPSTLQTNKPSAPAPSTTPPAKTAAASGKTNASTPQASSGATHKDVSYPPPTSTDPTAWNLPTAIPQDLDEQDVFPELLMPLIDLTRLLPGQAYPKPEFRSDVLRRLEIGQKPSEQTPNTPATGTATNVPTPATKAPSSVASASTAAPKTQTSTTTNATSKTAKPAAANLSQKRTSQEADIVGDDDDDDMPALLPARPTCEVTFSKHHDLRCCLELVGDFICRAIPGKVELLTSDRDSPERTLITFSKDIETKADGSFNLSQRSTSALLRAMDAKMSSLLFNGAQGSQTASEAGLSFRLDRVVVGQKSSGNLEVTNTQSKDQIFTCETKLPKGSSEMETLFSSFRAPTQDIVVRLTLKRAMKLLTSLSHLAQFGTHLDISVSKTAKEMQLNVNSATWTIPVDALQLGGGLSEYTAKNLPLSRILNVLYQARRLGDDSFECELEMPGVFLLCKSRVGIKALVKEERKKKS